MLSTGNALCIFNRFVDLSIEWNSRADYKSTLKNYNASEILHAITRHQKKGISSNNTFEEELQRYFIIRSYTILPIERVSKYLNVIEPSGKYSVNETDVLKFV